MYIDKVSYQKTFNLGNYSSERIGVDILLNEGEDAKEALEEAKKLVIEYHMENNKGLYIEQDLSQLPEWNNRKYNPKEIDTVFPHQTDRPIVQQPAAQIQKLSQEETIIRDIHTCTELKTLQAYKLIAKNNPKIQEHYTAKLSELTNQ